MSRLLAATALVVLALASNARAVSLASVNCPPEFPPVVSTFLDWNALLFTATGWIFIPAYCFAVP